MSGSDLPLLMSSARTLRSLCGLIVASSISFTLSCSGGGDVRAAENRPSIVVISIDSLRADRMSLYGHDRDTTPILDRLAPESVVYERAHSTANWSLISHASLLTGTYPSQHGVVNRETCLPEDLPTLASRLSAEGYHTIGLHFPGWLDRSFGFDRGFDHYEVHENAEQASEHLEAALDARPTDRPFFLFVQLYDVHNANLRGRRAMMYDPPPPFDRIYDPDARLVMGNADVSALWTRDGREATDMQRDAILALYDGCVRYVDHKIGTWIERLDEEGVFDDALFCVTAPHGEGLLDHSTVYRGHGDVFEEGLRVPLLVRYPGGARGGTRDESLVSLVDVAPTALDLLGAEGGGFLSGRSLLRPVEQEPILFAERQDVRVIYLWPWKLVDAPGLRKDRLIHLENDPLERTNLIEQGQRGQHDPIYLEIQARALARRAAHEVPSGSRVRIIPPPPQDQKLLQSLGYGGEAATGGDRGD